MCAQQLKSADYVSLFLNLENESLYSVSDLIEMSGEMGIIGPHEDEKRERFFAWLIKVIYKNRFPPQGDAVGAIDSQQRQLPAWFGLRWEAAVSDSSLDPGDVDGSTNAA